MPQANHSATATYLALFSAVLLWGLSFVVTKIALTRIPAAQAAVVINCIPVVTAGSAWFLLGERLSLLQALGGLVVLGAVMLSNYTPQHLPEPSMAEGG